MGAYYIFSKRRTDMVTSMNKKHNGSGYLFISPLLLLSIFFIYSFYFLIKNSFYDLNLSFQNQLFVGFQNYLALLRDEKFYRALINTGLLALTNIVIGVTIGYLTAVFLNFKFRGNKFFRTLFFVPSMLPIAIIAAVFSSMLEYREGTLNILLRAMHLDSLAMRWLTDPKLAMISVLSMSIYLIGLPILYYTAGLTTINKSILEAAVIDGAKTRHILFNILFPLLKGSHRTIILSMLLGSFREMERVYLMTDGGPGGSTEIVGTYIYRITRSAGSNLGFVCATAIIVLIISFLVALIQIILQNKEVI